MDIVDCIMRAYIAVLGEDKWYSLSGNQQHDVIMCIVKDLDKAIDNLSNIDDAECIADDDIIHNWQDAYASKKQQFDMCLDAADKYADDNKRTQQIEYESKAYQTECKMDAMRSAADLLGFTLRR